MKKPKLIVIVGPTASGKSELAVRLAKKFNGEIISADSRQVYRGLDIGTGKVSGKWQTIAGSPTSSGSRTSKIFIYKNVQHYCIDFVPPKKTYTVAEYKKCAEQAIKNIVSRGKVPILVGGTGFWIDAVVYDLNLPEVLPDPKLRQKFEKKTAPELLKVLQKLDPKRAKTVEQKNPRRIIRAIEIAKALGKVPKIKKRHTYDTFWLGLNPPRTALKIKIEKRVKKMLRGGLVSETKKLLEQGVNKKRIKELGFEYREVLNFLEGYVSRKEMSEQIVKNSLNYARRQMTWFKRNKKIRWINDNSKLQQKKILSFAKT